MISLNEQTNQEKFLVKKTKYQRAIAFGDSKLTIVDLLNISNCSAYIRSSFRGYLNNESSRDKQLYIRFHGNTSENFTLKEC
jgi:hypothetical protein